jgi:hypothetical protein
MEGEEKTMNLQAAFVSVLAVLVLYKALFMDEFYFSRCIIKYILI